MEIADRSLEYIGSVTAYDPDKRKHTFEIYRAHGYSVMLDGRYVLTGATHTAAYGFIQKEADRRGWRARCF